MQDLAYYNGRITRAAEMMIPAGDRAFYFGDGIYDVTTVHNRRMFAAADHLDRFFGNCRRIGIDLGISRAELEEICLDLVEQLDADIPEAVLYMQASRGTAPRKHSYPAGMKGNLYFSLNPFRMRQLGGKVSAITKPDVRFELCDIKTLNLLCSVLAQQEAADAGCYEAILHRGERVTEGSHSAVALIYCGEFVTPPLDRFILPSVTRKYMIGLCASLGIPVRERTFELGELMEADEVLIMSSTAPFNVCEKVNGVEVGGGAPDLLDALCAAYKKEIFDQTGVQY